MTQNQKIDKQKGYLHSNRKTHFTYSLNVFPLKEIQSYDQHSHLKRFLQA